MPNKDIRGKHLREGMVVIVSKAHRWGAMKASGMPVKVLAVEYPFVVFEYEQPGRSLDIVSMLTASAAANAPDSTTMLRGTFVANVKWCKFREVPEEYVELARRPTRPVNEPEWLKDTE